MKKALIFFFLICPALVYAWTPNGEEVTVDKIVQWEGDGQIMFLTSLGVWCYVPPQEKNMYSLVLSLYATGNTASIHCHDDVTSVGGYEAHRVHRVIGNR